MRRCHGARFGTNGVLALIILMSLAGPLFGADDGDTTTTASSVALRPTDREQWHMQALHDRLKITAAQEPLWTAVAELVRRNDRAIDTISRERRDSASTMTAVEDLRSFAAIAAAHAAGTKAFLPAFAALYEVMPAEQQVNADLVFREADPMGRTGITAPP